MKIDEKVFEKVFADYCGNKPEGENFEIFKHVCRILLGNYLAEIEKPICIKKLKKNVMIIRGEK